MAISLVQDMCYISNHVPGRDSKSDTLAKPFSSKVLRLVELTEVATCILLPFLTAIYLPVGCLILRYWLRFWMTKHIMGYTGDCLGRIQ
jgi:adenosylcobinamide-GDP ribazoletransferase